MDDRQNMMEDTKFRMSLDDLEAICVVAATRCRAFFNSPLMADVAGAVSDALDGGGECSPGFLRYTKYVGANQSLSGLFSEPSTRMVVHDLYLMSNDNIVNLRRFLDHTDDAHVIAGGELLNNNGGFSEICEKNKWVSEVIGGLDFKYITTHVYNELTYGLEDIIAEACKIRRKVWQVGSPWLHGYDPDGINKIRRRMDGEARTRARDIGLFDGSMKSARLLTLAYARGMHVNGDLVSKRSLYWALRMTRDTRNQVEQHY